MWTENGVFPRILADDDEVEPRAVITSTAQIPSTTLDSLLSSIAVAKLGDLESDFTRDEIENGVRALETSGDTLPLEESVAPSSDTEDDRVYEVNTQLLCPLPTDEIAHEELDEIDEREGRFDCLLDRFLSRSNRAVGRARATWLARAAELSYRKMGNLTHATELYEEAFDFAPGDEALISAAEALFDNAGRGAHFTKLLRAQADEATDKESATFLHGKVAVRCTAASDVEGAIAAHQALLDIEIGVDALRALVALLERAGRRDAELAQALDVLAQKVDADEACALRRRRVSLLAFHLGDAEGAKDELRTLLKLRGGQHLLSLELLAKLAMETQDPACEAEAREQQLKLPATDSDRIAWARSLADLYQGVLASPAKAIAALHTWASFDRANAEPYLRLMPLLEQATHVEALRSTLDVLSTLLSDERAASEAVLRAARISMDELDDYEGAWQRLLPRVVIGDAAADEALREVARKACRGAQLAELYVGLAQRTEDTNTQTRRWMDAAYAYEVLVGSADKAFEAMLRAFAKDMSNLSVLDEVDRLGALVQAFPRLVQVYDALARQGDTVEARTRGLLRHASLILQETNDVSQALERMALAVALAVENEESLDRIEQLVNHIDEEQEPLDRPSLTLLLCGVYSRLADDEEMEVELATKLLRRAATLHERDRHDLDAAFDALARAASWSPTDEELLDELLALAMRASRLNALAAHLQHIADGAIDADTAGVVLERLAALYEGALASPNKAADVCDQLVILKPHDIRLADKQRAYLERAGKLKELLVAIDRQLSLVTTAGAQRPLLEQAARIWEADLNNRFEAHAVWVKVLSLFPGDVRAAEAVERLGAKASLNERELLDGDLVVGPEDLRPSILPPPHLLEQGLGEGGRSGPESARSES